MVISEQAPDVGVEGKPTDTPEIDHRHLGAFCGSFPVPKRKGQIIVMFLREGGRLAKSKVFSTFTLIMFQDIAHPQIHICHSRL